MHNLLRIHHEVFRIDSHRTVRERVQVPIRRVIDVSLSALASPIEHVEAGPLKHRGTCLVDPISREIGRSIFGCHFQQPTQRLAALAVRLNSQLMQQVSKRCAHARLSAVNSCNIGPVFVGVAVMATIIGAGYQPKEQALPALRLGATRPSSGPVSVFRTTMKKGLRI